ncbi:MAG: transposase [Rickettsia endosymbiont of Ecitomorpha arachnoides]|nr:transposase [Rickettsia endosymbiont of Ecitomorpha arachnoides]
MGSIAHHWLQEGMQKGMQKGREEGMEIGIQKGIQISEMKLVEMAKRMLRKNKPLDEIVEFTGFTKKEIEELQKQLQQ